MMHLKCFVFVLQGPLCCFRQTADSEVQSELDAVRDKWMEPKELIKVSQMNLILFELSLLSGLPIFCDCFKRYKFF